jgi:ferric-dicitrate binding protein FerR (iron transport regulator)
MKHISWVMAATFLACGSLRTVPVQEEGLVGACREAVVFDHVSLAAAAALVSPDKARQITVAGKAAARKRLTGRYRGGDLEGLVCAIESMWPELRDRNSENGWVVSGNDAP